MEVKNLNLETKVINLNPKPDTYEPYVWSLSENLKKIAQEELREDENVRTQALAQLREWIAKHPKIKYCRTGKHHCTISGVLWKTFLEKAPPSFLQS